MATFVLLHGSFHAAWNWHRVVPVLERAGHRAITLDMPGHGLDATPASRVTLHACVDTAERYGRVPRTYIECLQDRAVTLALQRRMQADTPCDRVISLDTGHSPFFSAPGELAAALATVARELP